MIIKLQRSIASEGQYYFEIQSDGNRETLATSELYRSKSAAVHAIGLILADREGATFVDES